MIYENESRALENRRCNSPLHNSELKQQFMTVRLLLVLRFRRVCFVGNAVINLSLNYFPTFGNVRIFCRFVPESSVLSADVIV
jgi:hypothetical protein